MRRIDDVRRDVQRRRNARVSQLLLRDLRRHVEIVREGRVDMAELMPCDPSEPCRFRGRLQDVGEQLRLPHRTAVTVREYEIRFYPEGYAPSMRCERRDSVPSERNRAERFPCLGRLELPLEHGLTNRQGATLEIER
jgi:hypothetical protein